VSFLRCHTGIEGVSFSDIVYSKILKTMKWNACIIVFFLTNSLMSAQTYPGTYPQTEISNGVLRAKVYLPDAEKGFYRGTRFDWAGVIASLEYKGHSYFGPFFEKFDPSVADVEIGNPVVAGIASAASGPVEEFVGSDRSALGYAEAKAGETFCKIGVGALRKIDNAAYSSYVNYPIVNGGKRSVTSGPDWIEFTQKLECGSGYGYTYTKTIRFLKAEPIMTIEHHLLNTSAKAIDTQVYDHNFLTIDHQGAGPAVEVTFPFSLEPTTPLASLAEVRGKQLLFPKDLQGGDTFDTEFRGFGKTPADYKIRVENRSTNAGVVITGDRPLTNLEIWAVRTVVAIEPYIGISVSAGSDFSWKYTYTFHAGDSDGRGKK
jgi:hypothetical protein